ncbi:MAG: NAD-binding protein [Candidatus Micrarchaeota archaeon]
MYIVIVGAGRIGKHLAKLLIDEDEDVVVVDRNGDICHEIAREFECVVVRGDATKPDVLEEAGVKECDSFVALTGSDETNLIVSLTAKQLGAKHVSARLGSLHYEEDMMRKLGLDLVIYPEAAAAGYISELITKPGVLDLAFIGRGDAEILEIEVKPKSKLANKKISELEHPQGTAVIAIYEGSKLIIPHPDTVIKEGDRVLILAKKDKIKKIKALVGM